MRRRNQQIVIAVGVLTVSGVVILTGQQTAGPFTAAQATAGATVYQGSCAGCHGPALEGRNDAPELAGQMFMGEWGGRTVNDLFTFIRGSMPPGAPGSLTPDAYLNIAAYILQSNGARPGTQRTPRPVPTRDTPPEAAAEAWPDAAPVPPAATGPTTTAVEGPQGPSGESG